MTRRKNWGRHPLQSLSAPGTAARASPGVLPQVCALSAGRHSLGAHGDKDWWLWKEYALNTLLQENNEQEHIFKKIHLQLDCLLWQFTIVNSLFFLVLETTLSVSFLRQRKRGKYFPFKVTNIIVEKKITHLSKNAFCWKQELLHNLIWWIIAEVNCPNGLYTYHNG